MAKKGMIIVVSAPSGAGKTTLCSHLARSSRNISFSISYTTRAPRRGEKNGVEYFFVSEEKFKAMIKEGRFAEWAKVHGSYYGTPVSYLEKTIGSGKDVILDIDVQGGIRIRKLYQQSVLIFVMTPSMKILESRLRQRKKDSKDTIRRRLLNARKELKYMNRYDYLVINDKLSEALGNLKTIILAERLKLSRMPVPKF